MKVAEQSLQIQKGQITTNQTNMADTSKTKAPAPIRETAILNAGPAIQQQPQSLRQKVGEQSHTNPSSTQRTAPRVQETLNGKSFHN